VPFPRFSVEEWRAVAELRPSAALLVPTMIEVLLDAGALAAVDLRALHYGTAPVHPGTLRAALDVLPTTEFCQAYGMTEGGPISMLDHADHLRALAHEPGILASVGRPVAGLEWWLDEVTADGVGELVVRGPQIFQPDPDGWLRTGDLGRVDDDGFLFLEGRRGDTIIRGGENIYPLEVERVLERHPAIREAAVLGVTDRRWGQTVRAVIVPTDPTRPPEVAAMAAHCRSNLAGFKVPVEWELAESLPRNAAGKLLRRRLGGDPTT
jgi:acyl-CoA synthetase (AMP-forming)/AMP-acid ligase II